ncbi:hypothetical protein [Segetibacter aerophilus]|uniref:PBCV-specific basic adaptor domain-containing protein n=1 Tax=Segetibacter aerophilus TaxID=670293 RepID=A0A512BHW5_9BACT|nr:hypothetical protein [Segetibacter aerophilus]GEO11417.1 hypothetical protein SAE01_39130 [Segetibacter aerophilus]
MKKVFVAIFLLTFSFANAQEEDKTVGQEIKKDAKATGRFIKKSAKATGRAVSKGASAAGKKTAEVASKGQSEIVDKTYEGKAGPGGETIYITNESKYYWVDKKGHRHYVEESGLKDKQP